jgi:hypothetical protein
MRDARLRRFDVGREQQILDEQLQAFRLTIGRREELLPLVG